jgi:hypothetical protein
VNTGLAEERLVGDAAPLKQFHHQQYGVIMLRLLGTIDRRLTSDIVRINDWTRDWHPAKYFKSFQTFNQEDESFDVWIALRMDNDQWHQGKKLRGSQILPIAERAIRVTKWLNASQFLLVQGRQGGAIELNKIKPSMHKDVISSFWTMMTELESQAHNQNDRVLMVQVEGWFRQWNRMTGDSKRPRWFN